MNKELGTVHLKVVVMAKIFIAKQLAGKKIITNDGDDLGKLVDLEISEATGKIESIVVEPNLDNEMARRLKKEDGMLVIAYTTVLAAGDHIIIDKKGI
jgi:sporulation protein YlmC with PRC-barrel domain